MPQISPMKWSILSILMQFVIIQSLVLSSHKSNKIHTHLKPKLSLNKLSWKW